MRIYKKQTLYNVVSKGLPKPVFEISTKGMERLKTFSEVVLAIVAVAGITTVSMIAPNALQALGPFLKKKGSRRIDHSEKEQKIVKTFYYLKRKGYVTLQSNGKDFEFKLTESGKLQYEKMQNRMSHIPAPDKWDGKFWQVAADIPTDFRPAADSFRKKIKSLKFYPLQRTLWFYPHDPREGVMLIARSLSIDSYVTVMRVDWLDPADMGVIKEFFKKRNIIS